MSTVKTLVDRIRLTLSEPDETRWSNPQLVSVIDEAQKHLCRTTNILRESKTILAHPHQATYTLPNDAQMITRASYEGVKLEFMTYSKMDELSDSWETESGTPKYVIQDLSIRGLIRLNPIPLFDEPNPFDASTAPAIDVHYIKIPSTVSVLTDKLEVDSLYDDLIEFYVTGKLLRADNDAQNRAFGNEQFSMYSTSLVKVLSDVALNFVSDSSIYVSDYRRI